MLLCASFDINSFYLLEIINEWSPSLFTSGWAVDEENISGGDRIVLYHKQSLDLYSHWWPMTENLGTNDEV